MNSLLAKLQTPTSDVRHFKCPIGFTSSADEDIKRLKQFKKSSRATRSPSRSQPLKFGSSRKYGLVWPFIFVMKSLETIVEISIQQRQMQCRLSVKNWRVSPVNFRGHFGCSMQKEPGIEVQCSLWSTPSRPNSKTCFHYSRANRSNHQSSVLSFVPSFTNILEVTTLQKCRAILGSFEFVFWWIFLNFFFGRGAPKGGGCGWHIWWGYVSNYIMISFGGRK